MSVRQQRDRGRKPVIGLVGGIGSGKSTVARMFASLGCAVIDADDLARRALEEPAVRDELTRWWGPAVLTAQGRVDRAAVSRIVFDNADELRRLESLIHPRVLARRGELREAQQRDPAVRAIVDDTPLLMEKGLDGDCDVVVYVHAEAAVRRARVRAARGWSETELEKRQRAQVSLDRKAERADYYVDNNADDSHCLVQVRSVLSQILSKWNAS